MTGPPPIQTDPLLRFASLFEAARAYDRTKIPEPTAFTLATVDGRGRPSARVLLLKGLDDVGFVFYTNFGSRKGHELIGNPFAAMCFHWSHLEVQIRVEGPVAPVTDAEADAYFASRPRGSQIGAWASRQSDVLPSAQELDERVARFEREFAGRDVPRPPHWSGFRLIPDRIEFWKNKPSRLHEREVYTRQAEAGRWRIERLYP
jgi:pyridoxamine 5'-phosphate oxidase